jgi:DNA-binding SARP family transcriptional activator
VAPSLEIRVLGEIEVLQGGRPLALPASKKTRALLGYLIVAGGRPQPRQRLCELFWDGPDDPRAALRWSLTKIRPLVDDAKATRLEADREHVVFAPKGAMIDLALVAENVRSFEDASIETLERAAGLYRGEFLEGLDLPGCYRYHEWCTAEREAARSKRGAILAALVERLADDPAAALAHARMRVAIDPLVEAAHIAVMRLLARLGRPREALKQYESCRRVLEAQLGRAPSRDLELARSSIGQALTNIAPSELDATEFVPEEVADATVVSPRSRTIVGRAAEEAAIAKVLREATEGRSGGVLLFAGEPGIGKTRLLEEVAEQARALGGSALSGRAFEAEMVRPYGAWIDVLRSAPPRAVDASLHRDLAPLLPELGAAGGEADRNRLFDAVGKLLVRVAASAPLVVLLDDLQWFDESSVALLHYVARSLAGSRVLVACAARAAELDGNPYARALLRALLREGRLLRMDLTPLDRDATRELVRAVDARVDAAQVFVDGGGNPLFSLELARSLAQGEDGAITHTIDGLIAERLSRLDERAAELLPWAATLGHAFSIDTLSALTALSVRDLLAAVEHLEQHGVLRVATSAPGTVGYDFAHDLVRRAAYRAMSEPRRRWVHLHVARTLHAASDPEGVLAGDIAHHAALGGDSELAARAYLVAAERSLRMFAYVEACQLAASGLQHVERLQPDAAIRLHVALLSVHVHSNEWLRRPQELEAELSHVAARAEERGMHTEASRTYYLLSFVHHEREDLANAAARTLQAAHAVRAADTETRQHQLANTGRCLVQIEHDVAGGEKFLREAEALGQIMADRTALEMTFGQGLLHAFEGRDQGAAPLLERAAELAAAESDHWSQSHALTRIARMALEGGRPNEALEQCIALEPLVLKLSEGSEEPFVAALGALARLQLGDPDAPRAAERALDALRRLDSKAKVAYVLNLLADHALRAGRADDARQRASEALRAAEAVGQKSEAAVARCHLSVLAHRCGDDDGARVLLDLCTPDLASRLGLSARARSAVRAAAEQLGVALPGPA